MAKYKINDVVLVLIHEERKTITIHQVIEDNVPPKMDGIVLESREMLDIFSFVMDQSIKHLYYGYDENKELQFFPESYIIDVIKIA